MTGVSSRPAPHHRRCRADRGGQVPMPGEGSLAHHGILFLDERPECRSHGIEGLHQPLEEGVIYRQSSERPQSL
jgi:magnesium chelatase family protein